MKTHYIVEIVDGNQYEFKSKSDAFKFVSTMMQQGLMLRIFRSDCAA